MLRHTQVDLAGPHSDGSTGGSGRAGTSTDRGERGVLEQRAVSQVGLQRGEHSKQISIKILIKKYVPLTLFFTPFFQSWWKMLKSRLAVDSQKPPFLLGTCTRDSFWKSTKYFPNNWDSTCALLARFPYCLCLLMGMEWGELLVESTQIRLLCVTGCTAQMVGISRSFEIISLSSY